MKVVPLEKELLTTVMVSYLLTILPQVVHFRMIYLLALVVVFFDSNVVYVATYPNPEA